MMDKHKLLEIVEKTKDGCFYVAVLNDKKTIVQCFVGNGADFSTRFYTCGDEEGWLLGCDDFDIQIIRRIRL